VGVWFEFSLDGGSFDGCSSSPLAGSLATGPHSVIVHSADATGTGPQRTCAGTVGSLLSSESSFALRDWSDCAQSMCATAACR
jgi:hypothetical protein